MHPILISNEYFFITSWQAFFVLGAICSFISLWLQTASRPDTYLHSQVSPFFSMTYLAMIFGARTGGILETKGWIPIQDFLAEYLKLGAMSSLGGIIAVFLTIYFYSYRNQQLRSEIFHFAVPAGLIALAVGRIGCYLNGDDYGIPIYIATGEALPWWAVLFHNHPAPQVPRLPVQLLESLLTSLLVGWIFLKGGWKKPVQTGAGTLSIIGYSSIRFWLEFFRGDFRGWVWTGWLSWGQTASILAISMVLITKIKQKKESH